MEKVFKTIEELEDFLNSQVDLRDLNAALHFIANEQGPKALFGPIEGRLLSLLVPEDDDLVSNYLRQNQKKSYESLCDTFVCLAENQRRPTPLLRAAKLPHQPSQSVHTPTHGLHTHLAVLVRTSPLPDALAMVPRPRSGTLHEVRD